MQDEDDEKDQILKMLGGEVDDYAGSQLKDPDAQDAKQGVTIEISVKPHGSGPAKEEEEDKPDGDMTDGSGDHDPIAHILGMCGGGCTK